MKKIFSLVLIMFVALLANAQTKPAREELKLGSQMPQFTLESSVYGKVTPADLKGKVVLVNLFATWCGPCQKELAEIKSVLWPRYKDNPNFKLLVVGREHTDAELAKYNEKKGFTFPLYPDPKREVFSKFADQSIPRAYLYDKDGKLIWSGLGYSQAEFAVMLQKLDKALK